eukprot:UN27564
MTTSQSNVLYFPLALFFYQSLSLSLLVDNPPHLFISRAFILPSIDIGPSQRETRALDQFDSPFLDIGPSINGSPLV